jgi:hypothetical protein
MRAKKGNPKKKPTKKTLSPLIKQMIESLSKLEAISPKWNRAGIRKLKRIMREGDPKAREYARLARELSRVFRAICPRLDSKVRGRMVACLIDSVHYGSSLNDFLLEVARIKGRKRGQLRAILISIQEVALDGQRRQISSLKRDIPLVLKHLGTGEIRGRRDAPKQVISHLQNAAAHITMIGNK